MPKHAAAEAAHYKKIEKQRFEKRIQMGTSRGTHARENGGEKKNGEQKESVEEFI